MRRRPVDSGDSVKSALENRIDRSEWVKTLEFGDRNNLARGLKIEDVEAEISAVRSIPSAAGSVIP